jgi:putative oxidoreductase
MNETNDLGMLAGRVLLVLIFVLSGLSKITGFATTAGYMAKMGVPLVYPALLLSILMEFGGGMLILIGYHTRLVAILVFLWFIPVTLMFHVNTWRHGQDATINMIMILKNLSIMGGLLLVASAGPGAYSVDGAAGAD